MLTTVLPLAIVVGLSPLPILPAVLLLMSPQARRNGPAYLAAWLVALTLLVSVMTGIGNLRDPAPPDEKGVGWIQLITGAVFLVMAVVKWSKRPRAGKVKEPPKWMAALDTYTPKQSARLGALLAGANPKNLTMALAAGAEIALLATTASQTVTGVVSFVAIGSIGVALPVLAHAVLGERAAPGLAKAKTWLERNSTTLAVAVLVVLGILLVMKGLPAAT